MPFDKQVEVVTEWFKARKEATPELAKIIDEHFIKHPFSLPAIIALLKD
jgi:hypothetical protein